MPISFYTTDPVSATSRGHARERQVVKHLREQGWVAFRAPASLGVADVVAMKDGERPLLVEVKTDVRAPYDHFGVVKRHPLSEAAARAGGAAWLCWWPAGKPCRWIPEADWPT